MAEARRYLGLAKLAEESMEEEDVLEENEALEMREEDDVLEEDDDSDA